MTKTTNTTAPAALDHKTLNACILRMDALAGLLDWLSAAETALIDCAEDQPADRSRSLALWALKEYVDDTAAMLDPERRTTA
ncbi:hypothetical protein [Pararhodospirillum oryzae]|uniref:Uncharacterized protein n=1 Tax=Pararhodospirillum oryzae TaxID=478448 RepID=A0A512H6A0_9PROT|nr:hypothetical protein [Pararhodospirillum oryzae]GEO80971.1 hypothetical protein ROR02_11020 [Pararhodospirillum oryzae]